MLTLLKRAIVINLNEIEKIANVSLIIKVIWINKYMKEIILIFNYWKYTRI